MANEARLRLTNPRRPVKAEYKNNIFLPQKPLSCSKNGEAGVLQFLVGRFTFLGFEGQNWMLIVVGVIAVYIFFVWKTRNRL
jgi:hypothetical protein